MIKISSTILLSLAATTLLAGNATAQRINIDGGVVGLGVPANTYGAAAAQPGEWNEIPFTAAAAPLVDIAGAMTSVTVTDSSLGNFTNNNVGTTGDDELLMDDVLDGPGQLTISGLALGTYTVYTYAWAPDDPTFSTDVEVLNSPDPIQTCGGMWPGMHQLGITHAVHSVTLDAANPNLEIIRTVVSGFASCNGVQIMPETIPIGSAYCNPANVNSTGMPGVISATGSVIASDNDVTLNASGLPTNQFGFFLNSMSQGFVPNPGLSQGNLCLSGAIGRYNSMAQLFNSGSTGTGDLSLDLTNTPTPAGPTAISMGQTWNFQSWYRDLNPMPTSNFTDAVSITIQ